MKIIADRTMAGANSRLAVVTEKETSNALLHSFLSANTTILFTIGEKWFLEYSILPLFTSISEINR